MNIKSFTSSRLGRITLTGAFVGTVALTGLGIAGGGAFARVRAGASTNDHEAYCYFLQTEFDQAYADFLAAPSGSQEQQAAHDRVLRIVHVWVDDGCSADYGSILARTAATTSVRGVTGVTRVAVAK
jgi:hypothetical protein